MRVKSVCAWWRKGMQMAYLNNKLSPGLAWLYFTTLIVEALCSCRTRIYLYRCIGSYHPWCQHSSYSNFPSLTSQALHSNTKSNAEKRLKILTNKRPRFTNYHTTNKWTNCMSFFLNHFLKHFHCSYMFR